MNGAKYRNRVAGLTGTANSNSLASVSGTKKLGADWQDQKLSELTYEDGTKVFNFSSSGDKLSFSVNGPVSYTHLDVYKRQDRGYE